MYERIFDGQNKPAFGGMAAYYGKGMELFIRINEWLSDTCSTVQEITFPYGNKYGWTVAHRKKKKLIYNVLAENGAFTVTVRLSNAQFHLIYDQVKKETQKCIDGRYPCDDGGWIHYRVAGEAHSCDIQKLLEMKCLS